MISTYVLLNDGMETIGEIIRRIRTSKGWTQARLGREAGGLDGQTISNLENGTTKAPKAKNLEPLAVALGIDVKVLVDAPPTPPQSPTFSTPGPVAPTLQTFNEIASEAGTTPAGLVKYLRANIPKISGTAKQPMPKNKAKQ